MSSTQSDAHARLGIPYAEFIAFIASLMMLNALAIDIMLPALPDIGRDLGVTDENERQLILSAYLISFGFAQLIYGPLADRFGRKPVLLTGLAVYLLASIAAAMAPSFEMLLLARFLQGMGAAAPRVLAFAIVRDCFEGRQMARVMSLTMMVFILVPVIAPSVGQLMIMAGHWRWIFGLLTLGSAAVIGWTALRIPETLHPEDRGRLSIGSILTNYRITLTTRQTLGYMIAVALMFGGMFGFLNSAQQIMVDVYDTGTAFPLVFAAIALSIAVASMLNSRFVVRLGMRVIAHYALACMVVIYVIHALIANLGLDSIWTFAPLMAAAMCCFGLLMANLNALAMVPVGHIAGSAAAVIGFVGTTGGTIPGYFIGQAFNGTVIPFTTGFAVLSILAFIVVMITERGRMFRPGDNPHS
ncbi:DHA1 family bicyclomycin/chloramphenicol resistance-like MFS transporter [Breoghania corrubedonensis]|uniref:Bcr/CflA family efflux transporter n=1 Tax=Breoghania corrubedonensis TaxID=665038 RepID=A0A2T5UNY3_9HYPH|nr:multidrug effflux MFS transporter [Breoghania corrubedonensis]PTW53203.1 DHA1 family bicyclomycin/chloramphenicol resistance-like MFS transporter [Breoghania corrubedonensis]